MFLGIKKLVESLRGGSTLRFVWKTGVVTLNGEDVDRRTYHAFVCTERQTEFHCTETGTSDAGDLVMEWTRKEQS